jgi:hypothetical protein
MRAKYFPSVCVILYRQPLEKLVVSFSGWGQALCALMQRAVSRHHTLQQISEALIASGYTSLDEQAKALGIHRATTWTIVKNKHKLGRLNTSTATRILANPETPSPVRAIVQQYLAERSE